MKNKKIAALLLSLILSASLVLPVSASDDIDSTISANTKTAPPTVSFSAPQEETYTPTPDIQYTPDRDLNKDTSNDNLTVFTKDKSKAGSDTATTISDKKDVAPPTVTVSEKTKSNSENNTSSNNSNGTNVSGVQGTENNKPEPEDGTVTRSGTGTIIEYETKMSLPENKPEEPVSKPPVPSIFNEGEKLTDVNKTVKTTTGTVE